MVTPLKNSLEGRPTVLRVCRHLGIELTHLQLKSVAKLVREAYPDPLEKVWQWEGDSCYHVYVYPAEYIPQMISIINEYNTRINKPKRARIHKQPLFKTD